MRAWLASKDAMISACDTVSLVALILNKISARYSARIAKHERPDLAIIEAQQSEVRLDSHRETDGDGQGSGLSGEVESQFAGLRFARLAPGSRPERARWL